MGVAVAIKDICQVIEYCISVLQKYMFHHFWVLYMLTINHNKHRNNTQHANVQPWVKYMNDIIKSLI